MEGWDVFWIFVGILVVGVSIRHFGIFNPDETDEFDWED